MPEPSRPSRRHPLVGIVGGMGPLASSELVRTVYSACLDRPEQETPRVLLWSDPLIVDRTAAIEGGALDELRRPVESAVRGLVDAGARRIVIACVTAHCVLADLPPDLQDCCVSLVDIIHEALRTSGEPHLVLCTKGTAQSGLLSRGAGADVKSLLVELSPDHQEVLHEEIYRVKRGGDPTRAADVVRGVLAAHGVPRFVAACSDLHLVTRVMGRAGWSAEYPMIDPLAIVARRIATGEL